MRLPTSGSLPFLRMSAMVCYENQPIRPTQVHLRLSLTNALVLHAQLFSQCAYPSHWLTFHPSFVIFFTALLFKPVKFNKGASDHHRPNFIQHTSDDSIYLCKEVSTS